MQRLSIPLRRRAQTTLTFVITTLLCSCTAYHATRVVDLHDLPEPETVRRPDDRTAAPLFVNETAALVAKRTLATAICVEPDLADYIARELELAHGIEVDSVRIDFIGDRYAYYFPSRKDDFVLEVTIDAPLTGISGEYEARIRGNEPPDFGGLGAEWIDHVPHTGAGLDEPEQTGSIL